MEKIDMEYKGNIDNHPYVDLGLPSGLLWATCNVGANKPEEYGGYYAWGDTETKKEYTEENSNTYGKSLSDIGGDSRYDVARSKWGGNWRIPTKSELEELINECQWDWTTMNGVYGYRVTGSNGNSIFLPASGYSRNTYFFRVGYFGCYLSSTPYENSHSEAYCLAFVDDCQVVVWDDCFCGQSVRPVKDGENEIVIKKETVEKKGETMEDKNEKPVKHVYDVEIISFDIAQKDKYELDLRGKFEVKLREGKYFVERIKPQYPKTYEECCEVLALTRAYQSVSGYRTELLEQFQELLICRDAYWKIAGEQMGLGQPWKPDWENKDHESYPSIVVCGGEIIKSSIYTHDNPFAFPTPEMRDAFKENFIIDLEICKQFL